MQGEALLTALYLGDSAYPSGVFAFSWGLEVALAEGQADPHGLADWIGAELSGRWHPFDRVALAGGFRAVGQDLAAWNGLVDEAIPADPQRLQSLQAGAALIASARRMGIDPDAALDPDATHAPVAHGHVLARAGMELAPALAVSGMGMARGLASAALRLGRVGAVAVQRDLRGLIPLIARLATVPDPGDRPASFAPLSDIALMRPLAGRLFVN
ncbi:urease accessory protein UreF [Paracoccus nototheniae]|uniref:Urease accessory protein UreF n=1 Tax=Paracoccus nototheniae TaxID=2489002 RepID=A0ABW4DTT8_9RHOB|nr:urease accessory UreF family protein [Paracoccus nototheniae]